ncbi:MAG: hypothetical protein OXC30_06560 [Alphaproteobacteria bacterium]|nr:hypothetical protein [Alphaproteobacteria bacterium]
MNNIFYLPKLRILFLFLFSFVLRSADENDDVEWVLLTSSPAVSTEGCSRLDDDLEDTEDAKGRSEEDSCSNLSQEGTQWRAILIDQLKKVKDVCAVKHFYKDSQQNTTKQTTLQKLSRKAVLNILLDEQAQLNSDVARWDSEPEYLSVLNEVVQYEQGLEARRRQKDWEGYHKFKEVLPLFMKATEQHEVSRLLMVDLKKMQEEGGPLKNNLHQTPSDAASVPGCTVYQRLMQEKMQVEQKMMVQKAEKCLLVSQVNQEMRVQQELTTEQMQLAQKMMAQQVEQARKVWQVLTAQQVQQTLTAPQVQKALMEQQEQQDLMVQKAQQVQKSLIERQETQDLMDQQVQMVQKAQMVQHTLMLQKNLTEQKVLKAQEALVVEEECRKYLELLHQAIAIGSDLRKRSSGHAKKRARLTQNTKAESSSSAIPSTGDMASEAKKKYRGRA